MREKLNRICETCSRECKQPAAVVMVSCLKFDRADKTLDMFDGKSKARAGVVDPAVKKKPPLDVSRKKS